MNSIVISVPMHRIASRPIWQDGHPYRKDDAALQIVIHVKFYLANRALGSPSLPTYSARSSSHQTHPSIHPSDRASRRQQMRLGETMMHWPPRRYVRRSSAVSDLTAAVVVVAFFSEGPRGQHASGAPCLFSLFRSLSDPRTETRDSYDLAVCPVLSCPVLSCPALALPSPDVTPPGREMGGRCSSAIAAGA
ncbi:hypothetical protein LX32DRAFT_253791 [Colletotrichum zoysiae]|uniref:Uncharacterized protein n=1 Tax=Colletotrichum zoysiae TaxID=1216348 RepID=A0AAD9HVF0_9PEZI|nr:hypothetical protein LX32DRAFT_253791 [Colletotrichum zoysiae]